MMKRYRHNDRLAKHRIRAHERLNEESANYRRVDEIFRRIASERKRNRANGKGAR